MSRRLWFAVAFVAVAAPPLAAQEVEERRLNPTLERARVAYDSLEFQRAVTLAQQALRQGLSTVDAIVAWEITAYSHANMGNDDEAVQAFVEVIYLDPAREPDPEQIAPRIINAYATALSSVLVVRDVTIEEGEFVAGQGRTRIEFEVSRGSRATVRVVGEGYEQQLDDFLVARRGVVDWNAMTPDGDPVPAGAYEVVVEAVELGNNDVRSARFTVQQAPVDTVAHLTRLEGFDLLPEMVAPPRNWRPFGIALLSSGLGAGAALALESGNLESGSRREVLTVGAAVILTGLVMSIKPPDPRPVPANIQYNALLRQQLAERNAEIARQNAERRRQVLLTIRAGAGGDR